MNRDWQDGYDAGYLAGIKAAQAPKITRAAGFYVEVEGVDVGTSDGPFDTVTEAMERLRSAGSPGAEGRITDEAGEVVDYRGGAAEFRYGRTRWSR